MMGWWRWAAVAALAMTALPLGAQRPVASNVAPPVADGEDAEDVEDGDTAGRIIGGRNAQPGQLPFQVQLFYLKPDPPRAGQENVPDWQRAHRCGGVLIAPQWVLTAAHCFFDFRERDADEKTLPPYKAEWMGVRAGSLVITDTASDGVVVPVSALFIHPGYVPCRTCPPFGRPAASEAHATVFTHDIALVRLARPLPVSDKVEPIPLFNPERDRALAPGRPVVASGWGLASNASATEAAVLGAPRERGGNSSLRAQFEPYLQVVALQTVPCTGEGELPSHFCAGGTGRADTCMGDSGGPLVMRQPEGFVLVGITSRRPFQERLCGGSKGERAKVETRYSRVDADHGEWISKVTGVRSR